MENKNVFKEKKPGFFSHGLSTGRLSAVVIGKRKKGEKSRVRIKLVVPGEGVIELTLAGGNMSTTV